MVPSVLHLLLFTLHILVIGSSFECGLLGLCLINRIQQRLYDVISEMKLTKVIISVLLADAFCCCF